MSLSAVRTPHLWVHSYWRYFTLFLFLLLVFLLLLLLLVVLVLLLFFSLLVYSFFYFLFTTIFLYISLPYIDPSLLFFPSPSQHTTHIPVHQTGGTLAHNTTQPISSVHPTGGTLEKTYLPYHEKPSHGNLSLASTSAQNNSCTVSLSLCSASLRLALTPWP